MIPQHFDHFDHMLVNDWDQRVISVIYPNYPQFIKNSIQSSHDSTDPDFQLINLDENLSRMWRKLPPCNSSLSPLSKKSVPWTRNPCAVSYDDVFRRNGWDLFGAQLWWIKMIIKPSKETMWLGKDVLFPGKDLRQTTGEVFRIDFQHQI